MLENHRFFPRLTFRSHFNVFSLQSISTSSTNEWVRCSKRDKNWIFNLCLFVKILYDIRRWRGDEIMSRELNEGWKNWKFLSPKKIAKFCILLFSLIVLSRLLIWYRNFGKIPNSPSHVHAFIHFLQKSLLKHTKPT